MDVKNVNKSHEHKFSAPILRMIFSKQTGTQLEGEGAVKDEYLCNRGENEVNCNL